MNGKSFDDQIACDRNRLESQHLADYLDALATMMRNGSKQMVKIGRHRGKTGREYCLHGLEIAAAAARVREWASEIRKDAKAENE